MTDTPRNVPLRVPNLDTPEAWWLAQVQRLSAHLLLALPDQPTLKTLAGRLGQIPLEQLARRLPAESERQSRALIELEGRLPLARLALAHQLSPFEVDLVSMALLPQLDDRIGDAIALLRGGPRRPTLGLCTRLLVGAETDRARVWGAMHQRDPWRTGLLLPPDPAQSLADQELQPTPALGAGVLGVCPARTARGASVSFIKPMDASIVALRPSLDTTVQGLVTWARNAREGVVRVPGDEALGRELATRFAAELGLPALRVGPVGDAGTFAEATALAALFGAVLVVSLSSEQPRLRAPEVWPAGVLMFVLGPSNVVLELPEGVAQRTMTPTRPRPSEQSAAWGALLGEGNTAKLDLLGNQTGLPLEAMRAAAALSRLGGPPDTDAVAAALAQLVPDPQSALARVSRPKVDWDAVVLNPRTREQLDQLLARLTHRATVQDRWGLAGSDGRGEGLIALLHGEPGTGKTLVAEALAGTLALPLLRIDLSRVVSKYIGETEKNLSEAFDAAEGFRAVLFFDEADALFSRRTAVSDAHDRYANLETNYLLQRLEAFEGLALLATNALQNVDEAFLRRIPFVIPVPRPQRALQEKIWARCLPTRLRGPDVNVERLTAQFDLVGGEIWSAALAAAYAAAATGGLVSQATLERCVTAELRKRGRPIPEVSPNR